MDFSWSSEVEAEVERVIAFGRTLKSDVRENDHSCTFDRAAWQQCADFGILGWNVPTEYGGSGYDALTTVRLLEAFGYACEDTGLAYALNSQMWSVQSAIEKFANRTQKNEYLSRLITGTCGAFGITEEKSGSDTFSMAMTAERVDGGYLLNGEKRYITLAPEAEIILVFANSNPSAGRWGVSAFILKRNANGYSASANVPKSGMRTTPFGHMTFANCFVPDSQRIGPEGVGHSIFTTAMNAERGYVFASQLGTMQRQLENSVEFANSRCQSGEPISKKQAVSHRLADMKLRHELSRLLMYKAAWQADNGVKDPMTPSLAKLQISEALIESGLDAVRTHGVRGYLPDYDVERQLRDSVGGIIYSGTSDIQRNIIAALLGL